MSPKSSQTSWTSTARASIWPLGWRVSRDPGISASEDAVDELLPGVDALLEDAGLCYMKHLAEPIQVYHLEPCVNVGLQGVLPLQIKPVIARPRMSESALATCVALVPLALTEESPEQRTLAELVSDILLARLSTVPQFRVISRLSTEQFRVRGLDAREIARLSAAAYLVAGRLHGRGKHCLLFLELIDAETEEMLWAESVRMDANELMTRDETITPEIAQALVDRIIAHQLRRASVDPLPNLASQTLQFSAIQLMHRRSLSDFGRAYEILDQLVYRHPRASAPHAWLAQWHVLRVTKGWVVENDAEGARALSHTRRALDLNPDCAMTMAMEAFVHCHIKHDLEAAAEHLEEAVAVNTNEPWVWLVRATVESLLGHGEDAWHCALRARTLSPLDPLKHYFDSLAASAAVAAKRYGEAETLARLSLSKDARHLPTLRALAIAQVHLGRLAEARTTVSNLLQVRPDFTLTRYLASAPRGSEAIRREWASALREAGVPEN
jgi:TolB-like protein/Flp pilus assembly protein TadD